MKAVRNIRIAGDVSTHDLAGVIARVAGELPGVSADHAVRAEELLQALFASADGTLPHFIDRDACFDGLLVVALAQHALRELHDRPNVALCTAPPYPPVTA